MSGKALAKAVEHGVDTMKVNAKKSTPGVHVSGELKLEESWRQGGQQGM